MSNISSDPIRPGDNVVAGGTNSNSGVKIIAVVLILIFFVLPLVCFILFWVFVRSLIGDIFNGGGISIKSSDIGGGDIVSMQSIDAFELAARYERFRDAGLVTHADCEAVANAVVKLDEQYVNGSARWFGNGFCDNDEIKVYVEDLDFDLSEEIDFGKAESAGINIDMDTISANVLSFSDGDRCASLTVTRQGILNYQIESVRDSEFCKLGGAKIKLLDDSNYKKPVEILDIPDTKSHDKGDIDNFEEKPIEKS